MEYKIYKNYGSREETKPSFLLGDVFYKPSIGYFREHAATLIIEGDKYYLDGEDEEVKDLLKLKLEMHNGKALARPGRGFYDEEAKGFVELADISTPFDHPEFKSAIENSIDAYGYTTVPPEALNMVQVSSLEEAEKLRAEYLQSEEAKV